MFLALASSIVVFFLLTHDLRLRAERGFSISSWRQLWSFLIKKKHSPQFSKIQNAEKVYSFFFVLICGVMFTLWESFLVFLYGQFSWLAVFGFALLLFVVFRHVRRKEPFVMRLDRLQDLALLWMAWSFSLQASFSGLIFFFWMYFRIRTLLKLGHGNEIKNRG
jgi:hypothetical protein